MSENNKSTTAENTTLKKAKKETTPQQSIDRFWKKSIIRHPNKVFTVLPKAPGVKQADAQASRKPATSKNAASSYDQAAAICKAKVERVVQECRRLNRKYQDPDFDIEFDFIMWRNEERIEDCLVALDKEDADLRPMSVKRVEDIFDDPHFYIEGMTANNVHQKKIGDCWFMSAICTLANKEDLLERVCCARDEDAGVYGFVFHRDGEWISEIIDDNLYLTKENYYESSDRERLEWLEVERTNPDDEHQKVMQKGSRALYFAQCRNQNETWLPLLEKAYAKAHGDYSALVNGLNGDALEDMTGGIQSGMFLTDILDKDKFWGDELMNVNKLFLFGLAQLSDKFDERRGIWSRHSYSIMEAKELDNFRLLKIQNPWGTSVTKSWSGPWSNGSEEWTPERMNRLNYRFGNDGAFWISYEDLLKHFQYIDRTRLFDAEWFTTQLWTSVNVPWSPACLNTHFSLRMPKASPVVIVLSQLDDRYFRGLAGQYEFQLHFRLHKDGQADYIARDKPLHELRRSVSAELDLEAGQYSVMIFISGFRDKEKKAPEEVVQKTCLTRPEKLKAVGLNYDTAHAKGRFEENASQLKDSLQRERRKQRKVKARKAFEAQRLADKQKKLRRLRLEAKKKADKGKESEKGEEHADKGTPNGGQDTDDGIELSLKVGGKTFKHAKPLDAAGTTSESEAVLEEGTRKQLNITVEASDNIQIGKTSKEAEELVSGNKAERSEDIDGRDVSAVGGQPESGKESPSSTFGVISASSSESSEGWLSPKTDDTALAGQKTTDTASTQTNDNANASIPRFKTLTLDDISDDGLSWCSDIDAPPDSASEHDSDTDTEDPAPSTKNSTESDKNPAKDSKNDPWNAVCVVGLRVYSKGPGVEIELVEAEDDGRICRE